MKPVKALQLNIFTNRSKAVLLLRFICVIDLVFFMLSSLFIAALWAPAGQGLTSCVLCFVTFPCAILGECGT